MEKEIQEKIEPEENLSAQKMESVSANVSASEDTVSVINGCTST